MSLTKMATQQHPTNTAMLAENQALLTSTYLDALSISNLMYELSTAS
jgi:hypothetical protein